MKSNDYNNQASKDLSFLSRKVHQFVNATTRSKGVDDVISAAEIVSKISQEVVKLNDIFDQMVSEKKSG